MISGIRKNIDISLPDFIILLFWSIKLALWLVLYPVNSGDYRSSKLTRIDSNYQHHVPQIHALYPIEVLVKCLSSQP